MATLVTIGNHYNHRHEFQYVTRLNIKSLFFFKDFLIELNSILKPPKKYSKEFSSY